MKSVIFDMDGVLVDSEVVNIALLIEYLGQLGLSVPRQVILQYIGAPSEPFWECVGKLNPGIDIQRARDGYLSYRQRQRICYREILYPGVRELLLGLRKAGFRIGLASSTARKTVVDILEQCSISDLFDVEVCGDEVEHGKPAPDIFLRAAALLGAEPGECVVVEDSQRGVHAGRAAGMKVIGKEDARFCQELLEADVTVDRTGKVTVRLIDSLLESGETG